MWIVDQNGRSPPSGPGTRSPLIFWDIFPAYMRILFQHKKIIFTKIGKMIGVDPLNPSQVLK